MSDLNHIENLPNELLLKICEYLSTRDALAFTMTTKYFNQLLGLIKFQDKVKFTKIEHLLYFDAFTNVEYTEYTECTKESKFPAKLKQFHWNSHQILPKDLPSTLTHIYIKETYKYKLPHLPNVKIIRSQKKLSEYQKFIAAALKKQRNKHPGLSNKEYMKLAAKEWKKLKFSIKII